MLSTSVCFPSYGTPHEGPKVVDFYYKRNKELILFWCAYFLIFSGVATIGCAKPSPKTTKPSPESTKPNPETTKPNPAPRNGAPLVTHLGRPRRQKGNGQTLRSDFPRRFKPFYGAPNFQIRPVKTGSQMLPYFLEEIRFATCTWGGQGAKEATGKRCEAIFLEDLKLSSGPQISRSEL